jgi:hypothetical protein
LFVCTRTEADELVSPTQKKKKKKENQKWEKSNLEERRLAPLVLVVGASFK